MDYMDEILHILWVLLYEPLYCIYDLLPFAESITTWRAEFIANFAHTHLVHFITGFAFNVAIAATFGPAFGSVLDLIADIIAINHFFENVSAGLLALGKTIIEVPIFIILLIGPYVFPPIFMAFFYYRLIGILRHCLSRQSNG